MTPPPPNNSTPTAIHPNPSTPEADAPHPPNDHSDLRLARAWSVTVVGIVVALGLIAHVVNPYNHTTPQCPFHQLTGLWCPGCGSTRAACALSHGHIATAFRHNILFLPFLALLGWVWAAYTVRAFFPSLADRRWAASPLSMKPKAMWVIPVIFVAFWIVRNIHGWPVHLLSS